MKWYTCRIPSSLVEEFAQRLTTHILIIGSRTRNSVVAGKIPNINPEGWRSVAQLTDILGKPMTNLTVLIVDSSGADQMLFTQTLAFFSMQASVVQLHFHLLTTAVELTRTSVNPLLLKKNHILHGLYLFLLSNLNDYTCLCYRFQ